MFKRASTWNPMITWNKDVIYGRGFFAMPTALNKGFLTGEIKLPFQALNYHWHLASSFYQDPKHTLVEMLVRSKEQEKTHHWKLQGTKCIICMSGQVALMKFLVWFHSPSIHYAFVFMAFCTQCMSWISWMNASKNWSPLPNYSSILLREKQVNGPLDFIRKNITMENTLHLINITQGRFNIRLTCVWFCPTEFVTGHT